MEIAQKYLKQKCGWQQTKKQRNNNQKWEGIMMLSLSQN